MMDDAIELEESGVQLWRWDEGWGILPLVAAVGGTWAFVPTLGDRLPAVATTLVLVVGGWIPLWIALTTTDWATPLAAWRTWEHEDPLPRWPYLQPRTPGALLHRRLGQARSWWRNVGRSKLALPLRAALLTAFVSLLLSFGLGRSAILLTFFFFTWSQMALLWHEGRREVGMGWTAVAWVGLPWLLGATLSEQPMSLPLLSGLVLVLLVGLFALTSPLAVGGPLIAALFLVSTGHYFTAGVILLMALPGAMLRLYRTPAEPYRRAVAPWLALMILLIAGVL